MAERPDLDYVVPILARELAGRRITGVRVRKPVVLRLAVPGTPDSLLPGHAFAAVTRRAHFVRFELAPPAGAAALEIIVAPMLAGRFALAAAADKAPRDLALTLTIDDGRELRYRDDVQMGKVYVLPAGAHAQVPGFDARGLDVLDPRIFTRAALRQLARKRRDQAKVFLMDKAALDAFGNAYADEALWRAHVHPKAAVRTLSDQQLDALHDAMVAVLAEAAAEIARRRPPLDEKLRDFLAVRNRHGQACPRCGDTIRKAGVRGHDAFFCPTCQPLGATPGGRSIVDWKPPRKKV